MRMGSCPEWGLVRSHGPDTWMAGTWISNRVLPGYMDGVLLGHMDLSYMRLGSSYLSRSSYMYLGSLYLHHCTCVP